MSSTQAWLLAVETATFAGVAIYVWAELVKGRREQQKYKLYAMRDKLLGLVADDYITEDDPLFRMFYSAIDKSIAEVKEVNVVSFVKASVRARSVLEQETRASFDRAIEKARPEVRQFVFSFGLTMMQIMVANSVMLMLCLHVGIKGHNLGKRILSFLASIAQNSPFRRQQEQIATYEYFDELRATAA